MMTKSRNRFTSGVVAGAGATALAGALLFADPLGATEGATHAKEVAPAHDGVTLADGAQHTVDAGDAGLVTIERAGTALHVVATAPSAGWTAEVRTDAAPMVKVLFTSADGAVVKVKARLSDDGELHAGVKAKGQFDRAAFEKVEADRATYFQALSDQAEAERVAAEKAAAAKAAAEQAAAEKAAAERAAAQKATAASAEAEGDKRGHDGWCGDKDGGEHRDFEAARADGDHHDGWDGHRDHDGRDGHRDGKKHHRR